MKIIFAKILHKAQTQSKPIDYDNVEAEMRKITHKEGIRCHEQNGYIEVLFKTLTVMTIYRSIADTAYSTLQGNVWPTEQQALNQSTSHWTVACRLPIPSNSPQMSQGKKRYRSTRTAVKNKGRVEVPEPNQE